MQIKEEHLDQIFRGFAGGGGTQNSITALYDIMPSMSPDQMAMYQALKAIADKWEVEPIQEYLKEYKELRSSNRSLGAIPSFKSFLKALTLEEYLKGVAVHARRPDGQ